MGFVQWNYARLVERAEVAALFAGLAHSNSSSIFDFALFPSHGRCMLIFRANSLHQVGEFLKTVVTNFGGFRLHVVPPSAVTLLGIPVFLVLDYLAFHTGKERFFDMWPPPTRGALYALLFTLLLMGWSNAPAQFIYFNF